MKHSSTVKYGMLIAGAAVYYWQSVVAEAQPTSTAATNVTTTSTTNGSISNTLVLKRFKGIKMQTGRETRVPVSAFYQTTLDIGDRLELRTRCAGRGDTGMIVHTKSSGVVTDTTAPNNFRITAPIPFGHERTLYNDDHRRAGGNGKGSYICVTCDGRLPVTSATIYVFSQRRETASCAFERKRNGVWESLTAPEFRRYGGTLIDVGSLHKNDYIAVKTQNLRNLPNFNGDDYDTEMVLFSPAAKKRPLLINTDFDGNRDPKITIEKGLWLKGKNYLLVGKSQPHGASNKGVEVNVDVVHGPLNANYSSHDFGTSKRLLPGRYFIWLYAKTTSPIGSPARVKNSAVKMTAAPGNGFKCPPFTNSLPAKAPNRGALNDHVFDFRLVEVARGRLRPIKTRRVWRGQMGALAGEYNLFLLSIELKTTTTIAMEVQAPARDIAFFRKWRVMRNPDASDLTIASFNTLYDDGSPHLAKTRNAAELLATRGVIVPIGREIIEYPDQKYWQWDADIIGLQELRSGKDDGLDEYFYAAEFNRIAELRGSRAFNYVRGKDEGHPSTDGRGPLFVSEHLWPNGFATKIFVPRATLKAADCDTHSGISRYECSLDGAGLFRSNYAIPARVTVPRHGLQAQNGKIQSDKPIMAVNLHLRDGSGAWINRVSQVKDLIKKLKKMLKDDPRAFNPKGDTRARHHQNRIILMGDFNWSSHHCGEHYWTLEALRKAFGYAVDVAMAKDFDMHDVRGAINANGVPRGWQSSKSWKKNPASTPGFPWWMATYRGTKNNGLGRSDRYDAIILVGKGWAYDDPVRSYEVAWDRGGRNPMTRSNRGGIEMSDTSNLVRNTGYRPSHSLKPGVSPKRGSPALDSDHLPIRAKVRLFLR